jgi:hypothetical protein
MNRDRQSLAAEVRYCRRSLCFGCPSRRTESCERDVVANERKMHR